MKDAIWNWFAFWGPVARDVLSVGLAALGSYLAYQAIKMGRKQTKIANRQTELAERQQRIDDEERARRGDIVIEPRIITADEKLLQGEVRLLNKGNKTVRPIDWKVLIK